MRDRNPRAGPAIADGNGCVQLLGQRIDDARPKPRLRFFSGIGGHPDAVIADDQRPPPLTPISNAVDDQRQPYGNGESSGPTDLARIDCVDVATRWRASNGYARIIAFRTGRARG
jgi:hypothetical protein